jgi:NADH-quinone oxidoreductase subunit C
MAEVLKLLDELCAHFGAQIIHYSIYKDQLTIEVPLEKVRAICFELRDNPAFCFGMLVDLCGVDYFAYGLDEWKKESATLSGFSRGVATPHSVPVALKPKARFAVVYHLLSIAKNQRLRLRVYLEGDPPIIDSVIDVWLSANWYEREAFDLYGILYNGHPDLRRILTDYGFIGHPFRKDFPLSGHVEIRYDAALGRCTYEPVSIMPRTLVPKVIRDDNRYLTEEEEGGPHA